MMSTCLHHTLRNRNSGRIQFRVVLFYIECLTLERRKYQYEKELSHQWWKIAWDEIKTQPQQPEIGIDTIDDSGSFGSAKNPPYQFNFPSFLGGEMYTSSRSNIDQKGLLPSHGAYSCLRYSIVNYICSAISI